MSSELTNGSNGEGVLGDGALQPGKYNMALARRAIRDDWPIPPEIRRLIVNQMALVVGKSEDERNRISAAKVLVAADGVNAKREAMDQAEEHKKQPSLHAHLHANAPSNPYLNAPKEKLIEAMVMLEKLEESAKAGMNGHAKKVH